MSRAYNGARGFSGASPILGVIHVPPRPTHRHHDRMDTTQETRYHREVRATLDQQALVKELSSKQATHQQGLVETLVIRQ